MQNKQIKELPKRATLYAIAKAIGVSPQSLCQTAKRNPTIIPKGDDGLVDVETVLKYLEKNGKPHLRGQPITPVLKAIEGLLKDYSKDPSQCLKDVKTLRKQLEQVRASSDNN